MYIMFLYTSHMDPIFIEISGHPHPHTQCESSPSRGLILRDHGGYIIIPEHKAGYFIYFYFFLKKVAVNPMNDLVHG